MTKIPYRKVYEVTGYTTIDGDAYCVTCAEKLFGKTTLDVDSNVFPIFLGDEWDRAPVCSYHGCNADIECTELDH